MMTLPNIVLYSIVYSTVQYTVLNDMHTECISSFIYPKMYKNKSALNHMGPKPWSAESESCTLSIHLTTSLLQGLCLCGLGVTGLSGESSQITFLPCVIKDSWGMFTCVVFDKWTPVKQLTSKLSASIFMQQRHTVPFSMEII